MSDLNEMMNNAMKDPRFASILSSLKEKADRGELDVGEILGEMNGGSADGGAAGATAVSAASKRPVDMESHKKLLAALRPYLKDPKREAVDGILKIGEFSGIIEALGKGMNGGR